MSLIAMAVYSTEENQKDECLSKTLASLRKTVDFTKHRLIISVNGMASQTNAILGNFSDIISLIIVNQGNIGTAEAINKAWKERGEGEHCIKMDDDVVIHQSCWVEDMEEAINRMPEIGIVGLKRKDCWENPGHENPFYKSELLMTPKAPGEKWLVVEKVNHVMGTCQMYSRALLEKIGYLYQPKVYGFDDSLAAARCKEAGFISCFLPHIEIDHIDEGSTPYQKWKESHAGEQWAEYHDLLHKYKTGEKSIYYNPFL